jgi:hypothetical protein
MFEPVTFALAFVVVIAIHIYRRERRIQRADEFDGGYRHDNEVRVTKILSPHVRNVKGEDH